VAVKITRPPSDIERIYIDNPGHPPLSITLHLGKTKVTSGGNTYMLSLRELTDLVEALSELRDQVVKASK
jgi:hypothetical protein